MCICCVCVCCVVVFACVDAFAGAIVCILLPIRDVNTIRRTMTISAVICVITAFVCVLSYGIIALRVVVVVVRGVVWPICALLVYVAVVVVTHTPPAIFVARVFVWLLFITRRIGIQARRSSRNNSRRRRRLCTISRARIRIRNLMRARCPSRS